QPRRPRHQVLVSLPLVVRYQTLSPAFIRTYLLNDVEIMPFVYQFQKLDIHLLEICSQRNWSIKCVLKNQILSTSLLPRVMTTFTVEYWELVASHQVISLNFLREYTPQPAMDRCLIAAFLRAISGSLPWPQEDVDLVAEQLDWFTLSNRTLTDAEVSAVITKYPQHVHWYFFLKNNALTEAQIEQVSATKQIGAIEW